MQGGSLASFLPSMAAAGTLAKLTLQLPTLKLQPRDFAALGHITVKSLPKTLLLYWPAVIETQMTVTCGIEFLMSVTDTASDAP